MSVFAGGGLSPSTPGIVQRNATPGSVADQQADSAQRRGAELDEKLKRYAEMFGKPEFHAGPSRRPTTPNPRRVS